MDTATWIAAAEEAAAAGGLADVCWVLAQRRETGTGPMGRVAELIEKLESLKTELTAQLERDALEAERSNNLADWSAVIARLDAWLQHEPAHRLRHARQRLAARVSNFSPPSSSPAPGLPGEV